MGCPVSEPTSVAALRKLSGTFKKFTCMPDGMHPRQFAELSDGALSTITVLYQLCDLCGQMPWQVSDVPMTFIAKPTGGVRGIGSNRAFNRLWQRTKREQVRTWEEANGAHPSFSVAKGKSPTEAIWRQSVRSEAGALQHWYVAILLWDLKKCFEFVVHRRLVSRAHWCGYPMQVLRVSVAQARWPRLLTMRTLVGVPLWADNGLVAGGAFSTLALKAYFQHCQTQRG